MVKPPAKKGASPPPPPSGPKPRRVYVKGDGMTKPKRAFMDGRRPEELPPAPYAQVRVPAASSLVSSAEALKPAGVPVPVLPLLKVGPGGALSEPESTDGSHLIPRALKPITNDLEGFVDEFMDSMRAGKTWARQLAAFAAEKAYAVGEQQGPDEMRVEIERLAAEGVAWAVAYHYALSR